jgi:hypothetical protein
MLRVISVIGHGVDLLPHFIQHYNKFSVDEILLYVYESDLYPDLERQVSEKIKDHRNVKICGSQKSRIFDWEEVTRIYNSCKLEHPYDWWIVADIDEFHLYNTHPRRIAEDCELNGWDLVRGGFVDRIGIDGEFPRIRKNKDIFSQFPLAGFFRYPLSDACPNKICLMKGYVEITPGQHYAKIDGHTTWKWQGWNHPLIAPIEKYSVQVHHFKWDSTCLERIKAVADLNSHYAFSLEYKKMYDAIIEDKLVADNPAFMFEENVNSYDGYTSWKKLIKIIISI